MAKSLQSYDDEFHWVCDNGRKIGKDIYGVRPEHYKQVMMMENPQIMIVVVSLKGRKEIEEKLIYGIKDPSLTIGFLLDWLNFFEV